MSNQKQIIIQSDQVRRLMKKHQYSFIKNNEKFRKQLGMNQIQLSFTIKNLINTGFLKPWSSKLYQIIHNY